MHKTIKKQPPDCNHSQVNNAFNALQALHAGYCSLVDTVFPLKL